MQRREHAGGHPVGRTRPVRPEDEMETDLIIEDGMTFVMRAGSAPPPTSTDGRPPVLEVSQLWGDTLLDTRHFSQLQPDEVTLGCEIGHRWAFLGVDMGWIPSPLHKIVPYAIPLWSEVHTVGTTTFFSDDQALPDGPSHTLFRFEDGAYVAHVPKGWDAFVDQGDDRLSLEAAVEAGLGEHARDEVQIRVVPGLRLGIEAGEVVFIAHLVPAAAAMDRRTEPVDLPLIGFTGFLAVLGALFAIATWWLPAPPTLTLNALPDRFQVVQLTPPDAPAEVKPEPASPAGGEAPKRDEGTVGKRDAPDKLARGDAKQEKARLDRQIAQHAGLLGALDELGGESGDLGSASLDGGLVASAGGLIGTKGHQLGNGGMGSRGTGLGLDGTGESMGGFGPRGLGPGRHGYGAAGSVGNKQVGELIPQKDVLIIGALDRSLIDAVIKRNTQAIRYCYQRQLPQHPNLGGKLVVKFVIGKDGSVSTASLKSSTMNASVVEDCVVGRFQRMQFPPPRGGGIVVVSYPLFFTPG